MERNTQVSDWRRTVQRGSSVLSYLERFGAAHDGACPGRMDLVLVSEPRRASVVLRCEACGARTCQPVLLAAERES